MYFIIFAYVILLMYFPGFLDNPIIKTIPFFLCFIIFIKYQNLTKSFTPLFSRNNYILVLLICIIFFNTLRSGNEISSFLNNLVRSSTLFIFILSLYYSTTYLILRKKIDLTKVFYFLTIVPFLIYTIFNLLLWIGDVKVKSTELQIGNAVMLSSLGFDIERVSFPLATGINSYGSVVGGVLTIVLILFFNYTKYRTYTLVGILCLLLTLLLTDTRSSIFYAIIISIVISYLIKKQQHLNGAYIKIIPLLPIFGPFLLILLLTILSQTSIGASLSRSTEDLATGNSRALIWGFSTAHFLDFVPIHIIGYGEYGHYSSGVSKNWGYLFNVWENGDLTHPHNTILAILFDYGYLGVTVFIAFQYYVLKQLKKLWTYNKIVASCILGYLIYFNLIGITESFFEFYYLNSMYLYFLITFFAIIGSRILKQDDPLITVNDNSSYEKI